MHRIPNKVKNLLDEYGDAFIIAAEVCRTPISSYIHKFLNVVTLGAAEKKLQEAHYDDLYHLYLLLDIDAGRKGNHRVRLEKNQTLNIEIDKREDARDTRTCIGLERPRQTIRQLIENAYKYQEETLHSDLFIYDAFTNNCQVFVMSIIRANGLKCAHCGSEQAVVDFVMQDVRDLASAGIQRGVRSVTDLAAFLQNI